ncbi:hypothetical protein BHE74_00018451 [Ensete ventricosum]|nr:hypothetical protein BHE74_00018451 [Ensete ventricosum]
MVLAEEGSSDVERETATGNLCCKGSLLAVDKEDGSERSLLPALVWQEIAASLINSLLVTIKVDGSERSLLVVFMPQEYYWLRWQQEITADNVVQREIIAGHDQVAVGCDQGIWQREITVGSVGLREIAATCDQGRW